MSAVRVVATDVDGTFFDNHHTVPAANMDAARRCTAAGIPVVICTGKIPGPWSDQMLAELQLGTYAVYFNGGLIVDGAGETVHEAAVDEDVIDRVLEAIEGFDSRVTIVAYSIAGLDHRFQLFSNEATADNIAVDWIAGAGEHPPVQIPGGSMREFVREKKLTVNKLWVSTRFAPASFAEEPGPTNWATFEELSAAMKQGAGEGRAEVMEQIRHTIPGLVRRQPPLCACSALLFGRSDAVGYRRASRHWSSCRLARTRVRRWRWSLTNLTCRLRPCWRWGTG